MTIRLAAVALILFAGAATSAELGRLFYTPAQRATLDNARKQNLRIETGGETEQPVAPVPHNVSVNGVVRRSDGKTTVWLNNRAITGKQADGISVSTNKNDNRVKLRVPESGRTIDLKVGQTVEIVSGTIAESYSRPVPTPQAKGLPGAENAATAADKATNPPTAADAALNQDANNKRIDAQKALQRDGDVQPR